MTARPSPATPRRTPVGDVVWFAFAGAMTASLAHVLYTEFRFRVLGIFTWTNREFALLSMVGYLVPFAAAALVVALVVPWMRRGNGVRVAAVVFATLAFFSILLLYQKVHPLAELALALGLATRVAAAVGRDPARGVRGVRRVATGAFLVLVAFSVLAVGGRWIRERSSLGSPVAAPEGAPNVILLILDTVRAANMSLYGHARPTTPFLERLAEESTVFDHAFSVAPWTAPSHASMMTGLWAGEARADYLRPMNDTATTIAEVLSARGYATGGFMANTGYAGYQLGISRGFARFEDYPLTFAQALWSTTLAQTGSGRRLIEGVVNGERWKIRAAILRPDLRAEPVRTSQRQTAAQIADHFFAWRDRMGRTPYFAMLNFMDAHAPYDPPAPFRTMFDSGAREVDRYDGGIAYEDSIMASIADRLRARGEYDRTFLIVTSDHGEQWGEHGLESHGNSLYLPLLHVPLLVRAPGVAPAAMRIAPVVSLRDLAATILDLAGAPAGSVPGVSLANVWRSGSNAGASPVLAEAAPVVNPSERNLTRFGPMSTSLDSAWHFIRRGDGFEELFAWRTDSQELDNLVATPAGGAAAAHHRALLSRILGVELGSGNISRP